MRQFITILAAGMLLPSCFQEDERILPHEQGEMEVGSVALGPTYTRQVYYDLAMNSEVASNHFTEWDLSFESEGGGWVIRLNSSKFMLAGNSFDTTFSKELNPAELDMVFDPSSGNPDSTSIGTWHEISGLMVKSFRHVYLVDRGINEVGLKKGYKKVQFESIDSDYLVRFADNDNSSGTTMLIPRDEEKSRIHFSFEKGIVDTSPDADSWSLLFSRYTTMLLTDEGELYPYLVTGVLLNPDGVSATLDTTHHFMDLVLEDTLGLNLTRQADAIGYNWKEYDFDAGLYTILPGYTYVINDRDGFYYKLRFIDFYNDTGEKGYPEFEFVRL